MTVRSANVDFFAARSDQCALFDFLFAETDVRVFESYSRYSEEVREFRSAADLLNAFPLGTDEHGNGSAALLMLWSPSVMKRLEFRRINLRPEVCQGHTYRYCIDGGALMQLYLGGVHKHVLTWSHFGHQSHSRAQAWGVDDGVNWDALKPISNRIQYALRKKFARAKAASCPVFAEALELAHSGFELKMAAQTPWKFELSPLIKRK